MTAGGLGWTLLTGSHLRGLGRQSSEVCGMWEFHPCYFPDLPSHSWIDCGAQGPPHIAEKEDALYRDARREGYTTRSQRRETEV